MAKVFNVWVQIESDDGLSDPVNIELPDCIHTFGTGDEARAFVEALLFLTRSPDLALSDQLPRGRYPRARTHEARSLLD